jgi:hypothetical protein
LLSSLTAFLSALSCASFFLLRLLFRLQLVLQLLQIGLHITKMRCSFCWNECGHLSITCRLQSPGSVPSPPAFPFASFSSPPESRLSNMVTVSIPGWPSFPFFSMQSDLSQFRPVQDHTVTTVVGSASIAKTTTCSLQLALSFVKEDRTAALVPNFATPLSV